MASIVGERWRNATSGDIASLDVLISQKTAQLNNAVAMLSQAMTGITLCDNKAWGCVSKSGRHISTWRDQRDTYFPLVTQYKQELKDLQDRRAQLVSNMGQIAQATEATAKASEAIAAADNIQATVTGKKFLIYGAIALAVIILGYFGYKKLKK